MTEMPSASSFLTALPVYNEMAHVRDVLREVSRFSREILVVDDGSTDGTTDVLRELTNVQVIRHGENRGYGAALVTAFRYAKCRGYDTLVTIDCDGQHEPQLIPQFAEAVAGGGADIISGSRYLEQPAEAQAPQDRRRINKMITAELNELLHLQLTDAFCGFKAYRVNALAELSLQEPGYGMPLELWVKAVAAGHRVMEMPVPLIYLEEKRSFGGALDDAESRLCYYRRVIQRAVAEVSHPLKERNAMQRDQERKGTISANRPSLCGDFCE